ncbi:AAA family ATPase [Metallosphaera javensis (ex Hofmann et al. 2022)]|uniref:AAA family ATPase n=1 Tax=Metallosphaera javensis (ex Hofmann et al. 2022) TaxID=99938 RepID=UPI001EDDD0D5|nr:AAA family ATPase [Metallosphaera javensis (ex Hofmann et al. 2022)]
MLTGPRRVGKTTILRKVFQSFPEQTCYINLEESTVRRFLTSSSLKDLVIGVHNRDNKRVIFLLDEITSLGDDWAQLVKELWDYMESQELRLFLLVTGSAGILISNKFSTISGRSGYCKSGKLRLSNPLVVLPLKFSQFKDNTLGRTKAKFLRLEKEKRLEFMWEILKNNRDIIENVNDYLRKSYNLRAALDTYLKYGGFPQILERINDLSPENTYNLILDILNSIHKDAPLAGLSEDYTKKFPVTYGNMAKMATVIDVAKLEQQLKKDLALSNKRIDPTLVHKLIQFFIKAHILVEATPMSEVESNSNTQIMRLFLNDPAYFWAIYFNMIDMKDKSKLSVAEGHLLEHTVCSHISRLNTKLEFYNDGDIDVDCIFTLEGNKVLVQVSNSVKEARGDIKKASEVIKRVSEATENAGKSEVTLNYYTISVVRDIDEIKAEEDGVIIPAHLFLTLI